MARARTSPAAPAEKPAAKPKGAAVHHRDGCPARRTEVYELRGPRGFVVVTRCIDCGAQNTGQATDEPTLERE